MTPAGIRTVGAIDPELKTSPVAEQITEELDTVQLEAPEDTVCYYNGHAFRNGEYVRSGTTVLACRRGIWVEMGPADPHNP